MKWIIYWTMYMSSSGNSDISGRIVVQNDSVSFYVREYGYLTLPVSHIEKTRVDRDTGRITTAFILAKKDEVFVTIFVNNSYIEYWYERKRIKLKRK